MSLINGFGVVIPISGEDWAPYLANCLLSLREQSIKLLWRPIIVWLHTDEAPTGHIMRLCLEFDAALICHRAPVDGQGFRTPLARNIGAHYCPYEWVVFTDCDVIYPPTAFEHMARALGQGNSVRFPVRDRRDLSDSPIWPLWREGMVQDAERAFAMLSEGAHERNGAAGALAVPKEAWRAVRGYDEFYYGWGADDQDFIERIDRAGWPNTAPAGWTIHQGHTQHPSNRVHTKTNRKHYFLMLAAKKILANEGAPVGGFTME